MHRLKDTFAVQFATCTGSGEIAESGLRAASEDC